MLGSYRVRITSYREGMRISSTLWCVSHRIGHFWEGCQLGSRIGSYLCCIGSYLVFVSRWMTIVGYGVIQCDTERGECSDILIVPGMWVDFL